MKKITLAVIVFLNCITAFSQSKTIDSTARKNALAICNCLEKNNAEKLQNTVEVQKLFLKCMMDSASGSLTKLLEQNTENPETAGEEWGKQIAMDLFSVGCDPFLKISMKLAGESEEEESNNKVKFSTASGTIMGFEEKDFTYITIKLTNGREQTFMYVEFVPESGDWIKKPASIKGKKVKIQYEDKEVYQPKIKDFVTIKILKKLEIQN